MLFNIIIVRYKDLLFWDPQNARKAKEILISKLKKECPVHKDPSEQLEGSKTLANMAGTSAESLDFVSTMKRIRLERQAEVGILLMYSHYPSFFYRGDLPKRKRLWTL